MANMTQTHKGENRMNRRRSLIGIIVAPVILLLGAVPAQAAGQTARAALAQVQASAKKWQGDAVLVHLSSTKVLPDGTASEWKYAFYSPKSQKRCVVTARGGSVKVREVRLGNYIEPLGEFVDSNKAMEVAKKNGLKGSEPSMSVMRPAGARAGGTTWVVTGGWKMGEDTTISLDAKTGKFSKRTVMGSDK
jgi:hypothetical protein